MREMADGPVGDSVCGTPVLSAQIDTGPLSGLAGELMSDLGEFESSRLSYCSLPGRPVSLGNRE